MNKLISNVSAALPVVFVMIAGLACGSSTSDAPAGNGRTETVQNSTTTTTTTAAKETDLAGNYGATGTNPGGAGAYKADLTITKRDDVHQFSWQSGPDKYEGVGVRTDNSIAVAFTEGADGRGCGVVLYNILADGTLEGKAGYWGVNDAETETAKRTGGTDFEGNYEVTGTNAGGKGYAGKLGITRSGEGYDFAWEAGSSFKGFGLREGDKAAVGFGGNQCGFMLYEVKANGTLSGKWGGKGAKSFGTETLAKK